MEKNLIISKGIPGKVLKIFPDRNILRYPKCWTTSTAVQTLFLRVLLPSNSSCVYLQHKTVPQASRLVLPRSILHMEWASLERKGYSLTLTHSHTMSIPETRQDTQEKNGLNKIYSNQDNLNYLITKSRPSYQNHQYKLALK